MRGMINILEVYFFLVFNLVSDEVAWIKCSSQILLGSSNIALLKSFLVHTYLVKLALVNICLVAILSLKKFGMQKVQNKES